MTENIIELSGVTLVDETGDFEDLSDEMFDPVGTPRLPKRNEQSRPAPLTDREKKARADEGLPEYDDFEGDKNPDDDGEDDADTKKPMWSDPIRERSRAKAEEPEEFTCAKCKSNRVDMKNELCDDCKKEETADF